MAAVKPTLRTENRSSHWEVAIRQPDPKMAPFMHRALGYRERACRPLARREIPSSKVIVVIELGPSLEVAARNDRGRMASFSGGFVAGLDDAAGCSQHAGFQLGMRIDLTPQGAHRIFGVPMSDLSGRIVALSDLLPAKHHNLAEQLHDLSSWDARFDLLERVISEQLAASESQHEAITWAAQRIEESCGGLNIGELVRKLGYSHKHTLRLFNTYIGMSPKLLARLVRFDHLRRAIASTPASLAELAARFGYSDEAHLIREVRHFAGTSPSELRLSYPTLAQRTL